MLKKPIACILFLFISSGLSAQSVKIDSLKAELNKDQPDSVQVKTLISIGFQFLFINRDSALWYYNKSLALAHSLGMTGVELNAQLQIARAMQEAGNFAEALRLSLQVEETAEKTGDSINLWLAKRQIGWVYESIGDDANRLRYSRDLLQLTRTFPEIPGNMRYYEMSLRYMGTYFLDRGMLDSAGYYLTQSYIIAQTIPDPGSYFTFDTKNWGRYYVKKEQYDSALTYFNISNRYATEVSRFDVLITNRLDMARIYLLKNDPRSALGNAKTALKDARSIPDTLSMIEAASLVATVFERINRPDSAYTYLRYSRDLQDRIALQAKINNANNLIFNQALYRQQAENERQQLEEQYKNNQRTYILLGSALILMLVSILLYRNMRQKKKDAEKIQLSYDRLKATQAQLIHSEKMASLGELTAGIAHEIQNPLNFINNFSDINKEMLAEMNQEIENKNYEEAKAIAKDITENEEKINHHGKRADVIVKGMLQHSRTSSGQKEPTGINALCDEYLRLAYHGLRAKDKSFNAKFETRFDETIEILNIVPQEIGRVILNLINNAFYAVGEKAKQHIEGYEPLVQVSTGKENGHILIRVTDNGNGIPDSIKDKIFQPFFTTKPTGQGTGLGLSLSYDIVKAHGGEIKVESKENGGTEFIIHLPV